MKTALIFTLVIPVALALPDSACAAEEQPKHRIVLQSAVQHCSLGESIQLKVTYVNDSTDEDWILLKPDESLNVAVYYYHRYDSKEQLEQGYYFVRMRTISRADPRGNLVTAQILPPKIEVVIRKGQSFAFAHDFFSEWSNWCPGRIPIWIRDENEKLKSNRIEVMVQLAKDSFPLLLKLAADKRELTCRRREAIKWLQKAKPDFSLALPPEKDPYVIEKDPPEIEKAKDEANAKAVADFEAFWQKNRDSEQIEKLIADLNKQYGADQPAPAKKPAEAQPEQTKGPADAPTKPAK
jgi:hypothetical protein